VDADAAYLRTSFVSLDALCAAGDRAVADARALIRAGILPGPSYRFAGDEYFAPDLFRLLDEAGAPERVRPQFEERYAIASDATGALVGPDELDEAWEAYHAGDWGRLFVEATPEAAVRANRLARSVEELLADPQPIDPRWRSRLRARTDALAALLREGCALDRVGDEPHPWDRWVRGPRTSHPDIVQSATPPDEEATPR
jgi:hypothetical protein